MPSEEFEKMGNDRSQQGRDGDLEPYPDNLLEILNANLAGYDQSMGLRFTLAEPGRFRAELDVDDRHRQPYGLVHGGVYAAMIETVCSTGAAVSVLSQGRSAVGLENSTSFLRAVRSGRLTCEAVALVQGRRSQVWEARVTDDEDRLVAVGRVRLLTPESKTNAGGAPLELQLSETGRDRND